MPTTIRYLSPLNPPRRERQLYDPNLIAVICFAAFGLSLTIALTVLLPFSEGLTVLLVQTP
jgi:hypothetical protein